MRLNELKTGMVVMFRDKGLYLVIKIDDEIFFTNETEWNPARVYREDMTNKDFSEFDIIKVYKGIKGSIRQILNVEENRLIWERKEKKKMTISEIEKKLGYEIEIVKEK